MGGELLQHANFLTDLGEGSDTLVEVHALVTRVSDTVLPDGSLSIVYRFVHVLFQDALYGAIAPSRRSEWARAIAEALIATGFGLIVAIPAVWFYNYFTTKIDNLSAEMTYTSKEMIDYLIKGVSGEFGRSRFTREFNTQAQSGGPLT